MFADRTIVRLKRLLSLIVAISHLFSAGAAAYEPRLDILYAPYTPPPSVNSELFRPSQSGLDFYHASWKADVFNINVSFDNRTANVSDYLKFDFATRSYGVDAIKSARSDGFQQIERILSEQKINMRSLNHANFGAEINRPHTSSIPMLKIGTDGSGGWQYIETQNMNWQKDVMSFSHPSGRSTYLSYGAERVGFILGDGAALLMRHYETAPNVQITARQVDYFIQPVDYSRVASGVSLKPAEPMFNPLWTKDRHTKENFFERYGSPLLQEYSPEKLQKLGYGQQSANFAAVYENKQAGFRPSPEFLQWADSRPEHERAKMGDYRSGTFNVTPQVLARTYNPAEQEYTLRQGQVWQRHDIAGRSWISNVTAETLPLLSGDNIRPKTIQYADMSGQSVKYDLKSGVGYTHDPVNRVGLGKETRYSGPARSDIVSGNAIALAKALPATPQGWKKSSEFVYPASEKKESESSRQGQYAIRQTERVNVTDALGIMRQSDEPVDPSKPPKSQIVPPAPQLKYSGLNPITRSQESDSPGVKIESDHKRHYDEAISEAQKRGAHAKELGENLGYKPQFMTGEGIITVDPKEYAKSAKVAAQIYSDISSIATIRYNTFTSLMQTADAMRQISQKYDARPDLINTSTGRLDLRRAEDIKNALGSQVTALHETGVFLTEILGKDRISGPQIAAYVKNSGYEWGEHAWQRRTDYIESLYDRPLEYLFLQPAAWADEVKARMAYGEAGFAESAFLKINPTLRAMSDIKDVHFQTVDRSRTEYLAAMSLSAGLSVAEHYIMYGAPIQGALAASARGATLATGWGAVSQFGGTLFFKSAASAGIGEAASRSETVRGGINSFCDTMGFARPKDYAQAVGDIAFLSMMAYRPGRFAIDRGAGIKENLHTFGSDAALYTRDLAYTAVKARGISWASDHVGRGAAHLLQSDVIGAQTARATALGLWQLSGWIEQKISNEMLVRTALREMKRAEIEGESIQGQGYRAQNAVENKLSTMPQYRNPTARAQAASEITGKAMNRMISVAIEPVAKTITPQLYSRIAKANDPKGRGAVVREITNNFSKENWALKPVQKELLRSWIKDGDVGLRKLHIGDVGGGKTLTSSWDAVFGSAGGRGATVAVKSADHVKTYSSLIQKMTGKNPFVPTESATGSDVAAALKDGRIVVLTHGKLNHIWHASDQNIRNVIASRHAVIDEVHDFMRMAGVFTATQEGRKADARDMQIIKTSLAAAQKIRSEMLNGKLSADSMTTRANALAKGLNITPDAARTHLNAGIDALGRLLDSKSGGYVVAPTGKYAEGKQLHSLVLQEHGAITNRNLQSLTKTYLEYIHDSRGVKMQGITLPAGQLKTTTPTDVLLSLKSVSAYTATPDRMTVNALKAVGTSIDNLPNYAAPKMESMSAPNPAAAFKEMLTRADMVGSGRDKNLLIISADSVGKIKMLEKMAIRNGFSKNDIKIIAPGTEAEIQIQATAIKRNLPRIVIGISDVINTGFNLGAQEQFRGKASLFAFNPDKPFSAQDAHQFWGRIGPESRLSNASAKAVSVIVTEKHSQTAYGAAPEQLGFINTSPAQTATVSNPATVWSVSNMASQNMGFVFSYGAQYAREAKAPDVVYLSAKKLEGVFGKPVEHITVSDFADTTKMDPSRHASSSEMLGAMYDIATRPDPSFQPTAAGTMMDDHVSVESMQLPSGLSVFNWVPTSERTPVTSLDGLVPSDMLYASVPRSADAVIIDRAGAAWKPADAVMGDEKIRIFAPVIDRGAIESANKINTSDIVSRKTEYENQIFSAIYNLNREKSYDRSENQRADTFGDKSSGWVVDGTDLRRGLDASESADERGRYYGDSRVRSPGSAETFGQNEPRVRSGDSGDVTSVGAIRSDHYDKSGNQRTDTPGAKSSGRKMDRVGLPERIDVAQAADERGRPYEGSRVQPGSSADAYGRNEERSLGGSGGGKNAGQSAAADRRGDDALPVLPARGGPDTGRGLEESSSGREIIYPGRQVGAEWGLGSNIAAGLSPRKPTHPEVNDIVAAAPKYNVGDSPKTKDVLSDISKAYPSIASYIQDSGLNIVVVGDENTFYLAKDQIAHSGLGRSNIYIPAGLFEYLDTRDVAGIVLHEAVEHKMWRAKWESAGRSGDISEFRDKNFAAFGQDIHKTAEDAQKMYSQKVGIDARDIDKRLIAAGLKKYQDIQILENRLSKEAEDIYIPGGEEKKSRFRALSIKKARGEPISDNELAMAYKDIGEHYTEGDNFLEISARMLRVDNERSALHNHLAELLGGGEDGRAAVRDLVSRMNTNEDIASRISDYRAKALAPRAPPAPVALSLYSEPGRPAVSETAASPAFQKAKLSADRITSFLRAQNIPADTNITYGSYHNNTDNTVVVKNLPRDLVVWTREAFEVLLEKDYNNEDARVVLEKRWGTGDAASARNISYTLSSPAGPADIVVSRLPGENPAAYAAKILDVLTKEQSADKSVHIDADKAMKMAAMEELKKNIVENVIGMRKIEADYIGYTEEHDRVQRIVNEREKLIREGTYEKTTRGDKQKKEDQEALIRDRERIRQNGENTRQNREAAEKNRRTQQGRLQACWILDESIGNDSARPTLKDARVRSKTFEAVSEYVRQGIGPRTREGGQGTRLSAYEADETLTGFLETLSLSRKKLAPAVFEELTKSGADRHVIAVGDLRGFGAFAASAESEGAVNDARRLVYDEIERHLSQKGFEVSFGEYRSGDEFIIAVKNKSAAEVVSALEEIDREIGEGGFYPGAGIKAAGVAVRGRISSRAQVRYICLQIDEIEKEKSIRENFASAAKGIKPEIAFEISKNLEPLAAEARAKLPDGTLKYKTAEEFVKASGGVDEKAPDVYWHGSASGDLRGGKTGLHIGTKKAATEALEARIGIPADGLGWTGNREYGKTLLAGKKSIRSGKYGKYRETGFNVDVPENDFYPTQIQKYADGTEMPMSVKPRVEPFRIKGEMTNTPTTPMADIKANSAMGALKKKGLAKRGYFYTNISEDEGSISATVPGGGHLEPLKTKSQLIDIYNQSTKNPLVQQGVIDLSRIPDSDIAKALAEAGAPSQDYLSELLVYDTGVFTPGPSGIYSKFSKYFEPAASTKKQQSYTYRLQSGKILNANKGLAGADAALRAALSNAWRKTSHLMGGEPLALLKISGRFGITIQTALPKDRVDSFVDAANAELLVIENNLRSGGAEVKGKYNQDIHVQLYREDASVENLVKTGKTWAEIRMLQRGPKTAFQAAKKEADATVSSWERETNISAMLPSRHPAESISKIFDPFRIYRTKGEIQSFDAVYTITGRGERVRVNVDKYDKPYRIRAIMETSATADRSEDRAFEALVAQAGEGDYDDLDFGELSGAILLPENIKATDFTGAVAALRSRIHNSGNLGEYLETFARLDRKLKDFHESNKNRLGLESDLFQQRTYGDIASSVNRKLIYHYKKERPATTIADYFNAKTESEIDKILIAGGLYDKKQRNNYLAYAAVGGNEQESVRGGQGKRGADYIEERDSRSEKDRSGSGKTLLQGMERRESDQDNKGIYSRAQRENKERERGIREETRNLGAGKESQARASQSPAQKSPERRGRGSENIDAEYSSDDTISVLAALKERGLLTEIQDTAPPGAVTPFKIYQTLSQELAQIPTADPERSYKVERFVSRVRDAIESQGASPKIAQELSNLATPPETFAKSTVGAAQVPRRINPKTGVHEYYINGIWQSAQEGENHYDSKNEKETTHDRFRKPSVSGGAHPLAKDGEVFDIEGSIAKGTTGSQRQANKSAYQAYLQLLQRLPAANSDGIIIGGVAAAAHGVRQVTQDYDLVINGDAVNKKELLKILKQSGIRESFSPESGEWGTLTEIRPHYFSPEFSTLMVRVAKDSPQIDILFYSERGYTRVLRNAVDVKVKGMRGTAKVKGIEDLLTDKAVIARDKDLNHVAALAIILRDNNPDSYASVARKLNQSGWDIESLVWEYETQGSVQSFGPKSLGAAQLPKRINPETGIEEYFVNGQWVAARDSVTAADIEAADAIEPDLSDEEFAKRMTDISFPLAEQDAAYIAQSAPALAPVSPLISQRAPAPAAPASAQQAAAVAPVLVPKPIASAPAIVRLQAIVDQPRFFLK